MKARTDHAARPAASAADFGMALSLLSLWPVAWLLPSRSWRGLSRLLTAVKARFPSHASPVLRRAGGVFSDEAGDFPRRIDRELDANRRELRMQILRMHAPWGWEPAIELAGIGHLEAALRSGHGAVLWMSHFVFCGLVAKIALHRAGCRVTHLSRPEHGFSKTRLGIRILNPLRCRAEDRYLDGRVVIDKRRMHATMRRLLEILRANGIVSITAGAWEGRQVVFAPLFDGRLKLATGAPSLAWSAGAPLLPVHGFRERDGFRVVIGEPLETDRGLERHAFAEAAARDYVAGLEPFVTRYPGQWRGWSGL